MNIPLHVRRFSQRTILSLVLSIGCVSGDTFLIKSADGGKNWTDIDPGPPHHRLVQLKAAADGSKLYALTQTLRDGYRMVVSSDGGRTWEERLAVRSYVFGMTVDPRDSDTVYIARGPLEPPPLPLGVYGGGIASWASWIENPITLLRSTDGGRTTIEIPTNLKGYYPGEEFCEFVADASTASTLYVAPGCGEDWLGDSGFSNLLKSVDGGRHWTRVPLPSGDRVSKILPSEDSTTLYVVNGRSLLKTTNGGGSWSRKLDQVAGAGVDPRDASVLIASTLDGSIWKSTDRADSWQRLGDLGAALRPTNSYSSETLYNVFFDPTNPDVMLVSPLRAAGTIVPLVPAGLSPWFYRSEDGGMSWTSSPVLEGEPGLFTILIDPKTPATLYGASYRGDSVDPDGGWNTYRHLPRLAGAQTFVRNTAGGRRIAAGSLVSISGSGLAPERLGVETDPLPESLLGVSVLFNGRPAPLFFVSPGEVRAQVPFGLEEGPVTVEVNRDRQTVTLFSVAPVAIEGPLHGGDSRPVTPAHPARPGESVTIRFAGLGELKPSLVAGALPPSPPPETATVFGTDLWRVLHAGALTGRVGIYEVIVQVPTSLAPGAYPVRLLSGRSQSTRWLGYNSVLQSNRVMVEVR